MYAKLPCENWTHKLPNMEILVSFVGPYSKPDRLNWVIRELDGQTLGT
jgi:hypothetical protein